jgi:hypothetical protein
VPRRSSTVARFHMFIMNHLRSANGKGESILFQGSRNSAECSHVPGSEWLSKTNFSYISRRLLRPFEGESALQIRGIDVITPVRISVNRSAVRNEIFMGFFTSRQVMGIA